MNMGDCYRLLAFLLCMVLGIHSFGYIMMDMAANRNLEKVEVEVTDIEIVEIATTSSGRVREKKKHITVMWNRDGKEISYPFWLSYPSRDNSEVGDKLTVYYDRQHSSYSIQYGKNTDSTVYILILFGGTLICAIWGYRTFKKYLRYIKLWQFICVAIPLITLLPLYARVGYYKSYLDWSSIGGSVLYTFLICTLTAYLIIYIFRIVYVTYRKSSQNTDHI